MTKVVKSAKEIVTECWGSNAPAWVSQLAAACDEPGSSQAAMAGKIGRSASLVNMVLRNRYTGNLDNVRDRVLTVLQKAVECPVLGEIDGNECLEWQSKPYNGANHMLVRMFRACLNCPNRQGCKKG